MLPVYSFEVFHKVGTNSDLLFFASLVGVRDRDLRTRGERLQDRFSGVCLCMLRSNDRKKGWIEEGRK